MENKGSLIAAAIIVVVVLSVIFGTVYYLASTFNVNLNPLSRFTTQTSISAPDATLSPDSTTTPTASTSPNTANPTATSVPQPLPETKGGVQNNEKIVFQGQGFKLELPKKWGILKCNNSANFELDPNNSENKTVNCDTAQKPITVLVNSGMSCTGGEVVKIGNFSVRKTKTQYRDWLTNQWCFESNGKTFDITERVSDSGNPATSKDDFSANIESIISSISI